jgi:hypothetical protein
MVLEINAAVQSVLALSKMVQTGYSVRNANEIAAAVADVHAKLMPFLSAAVEAKEKELALNHRISELEKENMALKDWNQEAERYALSEITPGILAYCLKPGMEYGEPPHQLCANCFTKREKSILQAAPSRVPLARYFCPRCQTTFFTSEYGPTFG